MAYTINESAVAAEVGCSAAQLSLAWLLAQGEDIVPIPGTKQRKYLESNVAAASVVLRSAVTSACHGVIGHPSGPVAPPHG
mgnify:CR=1 FL=1